MESNKKLDYDSDIIICEDIPEVILVPSSPDKKKKAKKKKHKRKVKRSVNYANNMETLLVTRKGTGKKTKFKCVININTINNVSGERKCDSIVRYEKNVFKKEAYYQRILPTCARKMCFDDESVLSSSCRSAESKVCYVDKKYKKEVNARFGSLSPVSSVSSTKLVECNNISYEDVSNGSFSSASDEELETLIKRTKLRENKFCSLYSAPEYTSASTPVMKFQDISRIPSPFSNDTNISIQSDTTMVLKPLSSEAYSPTASLDYIKPENFENIEQSTFKDHVGINNFDVPYSPTMTPDLIKADLTALTAKIRDEDSIPYSPTCTPEPMKIENIDYDSKMSHQNSHGDMKAPYSLIFTPELIDNKKYDVTLIGVNNNNTPYSYSTAVTSNLIKRKKNSNICPSNLIYVNISDNQRVKMGNANDTNITLSPEITSKHIKEEMVDDVTNSIENNKNTAVIKRENVQDPTNYNYLPDLSAPDRKIRIKGEGNDDYKYEILVKDEKY